MEKINEGFGKNDISYRLLNRTDKAALFEQRLPEGDLAGYEVCRIHIREEAEIFGQFYSASEAIPSNEQFGHDGSKAFFPADLSLAEDYLKSFTAMLQAGKKPERIPYDENGRLAETVDINYIGIPGLTSSCIERRGKVAIYKRSDGYYEVFKISTEQESDFHGKHFPKREVYPASDDFGKTAWFFKNEQNARKQFNKLLCR